MTKKIFYALSLILLSTSCNNNDFLEQTSSIDEVQTICATIKDFKYDKSEFSRTSIIIEEDGPHYAWADTDTIGIFPSTGRQVEFSMASGAGSTSAIFTGGGWGLKSNSTYAAYFPLVGKYYLDKTQIPVSYVEQKQTGNASTDHLGAYDYLAAPASETNNGNVAFNFERLGCLVRLIITIPDPATLSKLTLKCPQNSYFTETGTIDLTTENLTIVPSTESQTMEIELSDITTTEDNEQVTIYFMVAPVNLSNKTITAFIDFEDGTSYETDIIGKNLEAGNAYALEEVDKRTFNSSTKSIQPSQDNDGTYLIKSASNLKWLMENCKYTSEVDYRKASYRLTTDIIFENFPWKPINFYGTFDGGNHVIENLDPNGYDPCAYGFFASLNGLVKNIIFKNPDISQTGDNDSYGMVSGVLAAYAGGTIINCGVIGGEVSVKSTSKARTTGGGLIGEIDSDNTVITGCYVTGTKITGYYTRNGARVGALIGSIGQTMGISVKNISITSCYTKDVTVSGNTGCNIGTFIGSTYYCSTTSTPSTISSCYYEGSGNAIGETNSTSEITLNNFEALTAINFTEAITKMNENLTNNDYIFGEDGSFVKKP